jgi:hypothetical protein
MPRYSQLTARPPKMHLSRDQEQDPQKFLIDQHARLTTELNDVEIEITEAFPRGEYYWKLLRRRNLILEARKRVTDEYGRRFLH